MTMGTPPFGFTHHYNTKAGFGPEWRVLGQALAVKFG
jgi:hypothetical protein